MRFKFLLTCLVILTCGVCLLRADAGETDFTPILVKRQGDVQVIGNDNSADWSKPEIGTRFKLGSKIKTDINGSAVISFGDSMQNLVRITSLTTAEIQSIDPPYISLKKGGLMARLDELKKKKFSVETPVAVASVKGSAFKVLHDRVTTLAAFESDLTVETDWGTEVVSAGNQMSVSPTTGISRQKYISREFASGWKDWNQESLRDTIREASDTMSSDNIRGKMYTTGFSFNAFYSEPSCADVVPCNESENEASSLQSTDSQNKGQTNIQLTDDGEKSSQVYAGDSLAEATIKLPYEDSVLQITAGESAVQFNGIMVVQFGSVFSENYKFQVFQAGKFGADITYQDGKTVIVINSENKAGKLLNTQVGVSDGSVAYQFPMNCNGKIGKNGEILLTTGDCVSHTIGGFDAGFQSIAVRQGDLRIGDTIIPIIDLPDIENSFDDDGRELLV